jgi:hypothetical protein
MKKTLNRGRKNTHTHAHKREASKEENKRKKMVKAGKKKPPPLLVFFTFRNGENGENK